MQILWLKSFPLAFSLSLWIKDCADWAIVHGGLFGAAVMMALESMIAPVPSEAVMPPLGFAVARGEFTWYAALLAATAGSLVGSLISYYLGYFGGKPAVMKVGKWLMVNEHHLDLTTDWFKRHGGATVFICRFVPVIRHLISIPAGVARMNLAKFCLYTVIGAGLWNAFLLWIGYKLQSNWETIEKYRKPIDALMVVAIVVVIVAWFAIHWKKKPAAAGAPTAAKTEPQDVPR